MWLLTGRHRASPGLAVPHQASAATRRREPDIRAPCSTAKTRPYWCDLPTSLATHSRFSSRERRAQTAVQCVADVAETEATSGQRLVFPGSRNFPQETTKAVEKCPHKTQVLGALHFAPANTRRLPNAGMVLGQRRRCWTNTIPALVDRTVMNTWWLDTEKWHQLSRWKQRWRY